MRHVGRPTAPVDWPARTNGSARYAADLDLPGMLVGGVLRSPHPHARLRSVDVGRARALAGVVSVLRAGDLPDRKHLDYGEEYADRYPLARDVVRHVGEPVALVAAETREQVAAALAAITVRYRVLPAAVTMSQALRPGAPQLHPHAAGNIAAEVHDTFGDLAAGRARAVHRVSGRYRSPRQAHAIMEPHTVVAHWLPDRQRLELWAPSQGPRAVQSDVAHVFGLTPEQVHLNEIAIGGDFGSRVDISHLEVLAAALSMDTGRPVMLSHDRSDEMAFTKSRVDWTMDLEMGADASGSISYLAADYLGDNGAYNMAGPSEVLYGSIALGSVYRATGYEVRGRCVYTNRQPTSSFRGAGGFAPLFGIEVLADEMADQVGLDPIDFRARNAVQDLGETGVTGWRVKSSKLAECLATVRREIDWDRKRAAGGQGHGVGVAAVIHVTGMRREGMVESGAAVDILADGRVRLRSGCGDPGTGQKTMLAQVVAEELNVGLDRVDVVTIDTDRTLHDTGAGASRGTFVSGHAVALAARTAADAIRELAAEKFACSAADVTLADGYAKAAGDQVAYEDLILLSPDGQQGELRVETEYVGDTEEGGYSGYGDVSAAYSFAAQAVEVEVDRETGAVRVVQVVAAHDSGRILNPLTARGQVEGGIVMSLGAALSEELLHEGGQLVNAGFVDYHLPRSADAPPIRVFFLGDDDPEGPYGAKGLGEIALLPTAAAVVNAVSHAIGRRVREVPLTPDRVLGALADERQPVPVRPLWQRPDRWWIAFMRWAYPRGLHHLLHRYGTRFARPAPTGEIREIVAVDDVDEAVTALAGPDRAAPLGGGVDVLAARKQGLPIAPVLVDLTRCGPLRQVGLTEGGDLAIGAAVTLAELHDDPRTPRVLRDTIAQIASPQVRNVATVAGNLAQEKRCPFYRNGFPCYKRSGPLSPCYAVLGDHRFSHAVVDGHRCQAVTPSDLATALLALDGRVRIQGPDSAREVTVADFYQGPGETVLRPGELVVDVVVPQAALGRRSAYRKVQLSEGGFAAVAAAVCVGLGDDGRVQHCRVSLGAVAPVPFRARAVEDALLGRVPDDALVAEASRRWAGSAHPLPGNGWKLEAGAGLVRQALAEALGLEV